MNNTDIIIEITSKVFKQLPIEQCRYIISYSYQPNVVGLWFIEVSYLVNGSWGKYKKEISDYDLIKTIKHDTTNSYISNTVQEIVNKSIYIKHEY